MVKKKVSEGKTNVGLVVGIVVVVLVVLLLVFIFGKGISGNVVYDEESGFEDFYGLFELNDEFDCSDPNVIVGQLMRKMVLANLLTG